MGCALSMPTSKGVRALPTMPILATFVEGALPFTVEHPPTT
ncbi:MAG: hypothetical protein AAF654_07970 [Myxococcota bacterium]